MNRLWPVLLPDLRRFPAAEREAALRAARHTALDLTELLGMAAGLVLVTALTRYGVADTALPSRLAAAALHFIVAIPLLAVCLGPFQLRRLRRGLRGQLHAREPQ